MPHRSQESRVAVGSEDAPALELGASCSNRIVFFNYVRLFFSCCLRPSYQCGCLSFCLSSLIRYDVSTRCVRMSNLWSAWDRRGIQSRRRSCGSALDHALSDRETVWQGRCRREGWEGGLEVTVRKRLRRWVKHENGEGEMERDDIRIEDTLSHACTRFLYAIEKVSKKCACNTECLHTPVTHRSCHYVGANS